MTRPLALILACLALAGTAAAADSDPTQTIRIGRDIHITEAVDGPLRAAGRKVTVDAPVNGDLSIAAGSVRIDAPIAGDASVAAGSLELGPHARIEGKLSYHGGDLRQDAAAQVVGGIEQAQGRHHSHAPRTAVERFVRGWMWSVGLMVLAALIAGALPGFSNRMAQELRERPWLTPLLGIVALTSIPIAAVLVMITVIGIPIGLLALVGYAALLMVGYVWIAVVVGAMLLDRIKPEVAAQTAWRVGAAVLAMLVLAILVRAPFVGGLVRLAALVAGVGMIVATLLRRATPQDPASRSASSGVLT